MNKIKHIERINEKEQNINSQGSWHTDYADSPYVYIGGLDYELTEGDLLRVFSQFGEIGDMDLRRDKKTGKSLGFCFIGYCAIKSTILAVDNMNGVELVGRRITVDHKKDYKPPKDRNLDDDDEDENPKKRKRDLVPLVIDEEEEELKRKKKARKKDKKSRGSEKNQQKVMRMAFAQGTSTTVDELHEYVKEKRKDKSSSSSRRDRR
jgi:RNA-binding motif X-linked protein 2